MFPSEEILASSTNYLEIKHEIIWLLYMNVYFHMLYTSLYIFSEINVTYWHDHDMEVVIQHTAV